MRRTCRQCGINLGTGSQETYRLVGQDFECWPCALDDPAFVARLRQSYSYAGKVYAR